MMRMEDGPHIQTLKTYIKRLRLLMEVPHNSQPFMEVNLGEIHPPVATICMKGLLMKRQITSGTSYSNKICLNEKTTEGGLV